jgi:protease IV
LRKAKNDKKIKAIVLRINSPGGSALASDVMWREIQLTKKVKPVIASMGSVAASGGYYMAMGCDTIVALPTTITGSIGIFWYVIQCTRIDEQ